MGFGADAEPYPVLKYASLTEALRFQLSGIWFRYADLLTTGRPFKVLAMFLLGLWVGRSGLLRDIEPWVPLLRRVRLVGLAVGLPAALVQALMEVRPGPSDSPWKLLGSAAYALGVAPLAWPTPRTSRCSGAARLARSPGLGDSCRPNGADQLPDADRHRHRAVLRHRPGADGAGGPGHLAAHCRRGRGLCRRPPAGGGSAGSRSARWNGCGGLATYGRFSADSSSAAPRRLL